MSLIDALVARWAVPASRRVLWLGMCSLLLVFGGGWLIVMRGAGREAEVAAAALRVGAESPDFTVETLSAAPFTLSDVRGRPVWISFWASWCPPCRAEMPDIEQVRAEAGDRLEFIAVNMDESRSTITSYMADGRYDFPTGVDPQGLVSRRYRVVGLPTHVFVAADGTIVAIRVGGMTRSAMSETVGALVRGRPIGPSSPDVAVGGSGVSLGRAVYNAQCLRCHGGEDGTGGAPGVPPHTDEGHTWHHSDLHLTAVITRGGHGMPGFGDRLTPVEVRAVLAYLKTWWGDEQREFQEQVTKENDRGRN